MAYGLKASSCDPLDNDQQPLFHDTLAHVLEELIFLYHYVNKKTK